MSNVPKSPSPLRNDFSTFPSRSTSYNVHQKPQQLTPLSRLPIPRSQSTSSLHESTGQLQDLVSDLKEKQRQQRDEIEEKKKLEASKSSLSRHASAVVRYYNKARSRSPSLSKALPSTPKSPKPVPQTFPPRPPLTQQPPEPRLQRADSRVHVHVAPAPLLAPSAAVIEEVVLSPAVTDTAVIEDPVAAEEEQPQRHPYESHRSEKVELDTHKYEEKVELSEETSSKKSSGRPRNSENRRQAPIRSISLPPSHKSWQSIRFNEADEWVQKGIQYHERGELEQATLEFKRAAKVELPLGMFLYGLSLRHGWGCKRSERTAFRYLQKSAEHAIFDLQTLFSGRGTKLIANRELVLAIYELGVSSRHGWGCPKDKTQAFYFFKIAADLGDADAQNELAQCFHHGNGVKKNMALAAKYYRKADKQGRGFVGNSWIYKNKYGDP